jgi:translation initiation factor 3 subunit C
MSRFFAAGSDSESEYSSSDKSDQTFSDAISDSSDDEEVQVTGARKWLKQQVSDSDSEDEKKQVKSQKNRRFDELRILSKSLEKACKSKDWITLLADFDKIQKNIVKSDVLIKREGIPRFFIRALDYLEKMMQENEDLKKMNPSTAKAYNVIKQKLKKEFKTRHEDLEKFRLVFSIFILEPCR